MLEIRNLSKKFDGVSAVSDVSFSLDEIRISGLIGPNGSGKTTLFHMITGFYTSDAGEVFFKGNRITGLPAHEISRTGLVRTFQHSRVLPFLSVMDNLIAAAPAQSGERIFPLFFRHRKVENQEAALRKKARKILDQVQLSALSDHLAGNLSYGQQKLLELGRVLMADPTLILLDEPTAGVNPVLIHRLTDILLNLSKTGIRIFLIEHNIKLVSSLCESVFVMDAGKLIFSGPPLAAQQDPMVIEAYLGRSIHAPDS